MPEARHPRISARLWTVQDALLEEEGAQADGGFAGDTNLVSLKSSALAAGMAGKEHASRDAHEVCFLRDQAGFRLCAPLLQALAARSQAHPGPLDMTLLRGLWLCRMPFLGRLGHCMPAQLLMLDLEGVTNMRAQSTR